LNHRSWKSINGEEAMIDSLISKLLGIGGLNSADKLEKLIDSAVKGKVINGFAAQMIKNIIAASQKEINKIMVPRVDMVVVSDDMPLKEAIEIYKKFGFSKMPVISDRSDRVVGILYIKELIKNLDQIDNGKVNKFKRKAYFLPESKKVLDTLKFFQKKHLSIAIVVDEFGSVIGLVTLEDILEEIVGEIWEEFDKEEKLYRKLKDGSFEFNAKIDLEEVSELLGIKFDVDDFHTLSGFIMSRVERFPEVNTRVVYEGYEFIVTEATQQRIKKVVVKKLSPPEPQKNSD
jgi:putative hemolysin